MGDEDREEAGEDDVLHLYQLDDRDLTTRALSAMAEVQLGVCMSRPYSDIEKLIERLHGDEPDGPEEAWCDAFTENPFRLGCTEGEFAYLPQEDFEQAFAKEPIWCLRVMASHAERDPGIALLYEGCMRLVMGQIARARWHSEDRLDTEALIRVAEETLRYTLELDSKASVEWLRKMVDAIREAAVTDYDWPPESDQD